jgi:hypothetical protein
MGTDTFSHMYYLKGWKINDSKEYDEQVYRYYEVIDEYLAQLKNLSNENTTLIVLSDHGTQNLDFETYKTSKSSFYNKTSKMYKTNAAPHTSKGIFLINGPNIISKRISLSMVDVLPTIYRILNKSFSSSDFDGVAIEDIFNETYGLKNNISRLNPDKYAYLSYNLTGKIQSGNFGDQDASHLYGIINDSFYSQDNYNYPNIYTSDDFSTFRISTRINNNSLSNPDGVYNSIEYGIYKDIMDSLISSKDTSYIYSVDIYISYNRRFVDEASNYPKETTFNIFCHNISFSPSCSLNNDSDLFYYDTFHIKYVFNNFSYNYASDYILSNVLMN